MKFRTLALAVAMAVLSFQSCSEKSGENQNETDNVQQSAQVAQTPTLPDLKIADAKGATMQLSSLKGKKVFVNLWASWCPPCKIEMPSIKELYGKSDLQEVAFILLSLDDPRDHDKALSFMKENNLNLPVYFPMEQLPPLFNVQGIPSTFIFDENGELIERIDGIEDYTQARFVELFNGTKS